MLHQRIFRRKLVFYGLPLGPSNFFMRGSYFVFGNYGFMFSCLGRSGSQSLWVPYCNELGLKVFHPKGFSGTLPKAYTYFKVQKMLFDVGLAPEPINFLRLDVELVKCGAVGSPWVCYGIVMGHVLRGSLDQTLKNLELFGVEINSFVSKTVRDYLLKKNNDALNLYEYQRLCSFFEVHEESAVQEIIKDIKDRIPSSIDVGNDLFSLSNIVLDKHGDVKIIDCDTASVKVC